MKTSIPPALRQVLLLMTPGILLLSAPELWADPGKPEYLAADPLEYDSGTLKGKDGGTGWNSPWGGNFAEFFLSTTTGAKVEGLTTGGADGKSANAVRRFASPVQEDAPLYFAVEIRVNELSGQYFSILKLHQSPTGDPQNFVGIGIMNDKVFGMGGNLSAQDGQFEKIPHSGTFLLVGKIAFEGEDVATLSIWVNPKDETSTNAMRTFENIGLPKMPFFLAELFVTKFESPGEITFRNLIVSKEWPVPTRD